jgi:hypothetical protein
MTMSDWDGTDTTGTTGTEAGHVDAGEQHSDLDHGQAAYGNEHDASQDYDAFGQANSYEHDVDFNQGHHVEYDNPSGAHYAETDYTNYSGHEAASSAAFGEHYAADSHDASFADLDHLRESFDAQYLHADGAGSGEQALAAR